MSCKEISLNQMNVASTNINILGERLKSPYICPISHIKLSQVYNVNQLFLGFNHILITFIFNLVYFRKKLFFFSSKDLSIRQILSLPGTIPLKTNEYTTSKSTVTAMQSGGSQMGGFAYWWSCIKEGLLPIGLLGLVKLNLFHDIFVTTLIGRNRNFYICFELTKSE